MVAGSPDGLRK